MKLKQSIIIPHSDNKRKQLYVEVMAKTTSHRASGIKARNTIIAKHGDNYYARIGKKGGSKTNTEPKGFEANRALARIAGAKGGRASHK